MAEHRIAEEPDEDIVGDMSDRPFMTNRIHMSS